MPRCLLGILALCVACGPAVQPAALSADRTSLEFATTAPGGTSPGVSLRVSNAGASSSDTLAVTLDGADAADFAIVSDGCSGATLSPAAACDVQLVFRPSAERLSAGELHVAAGRAALTVALAGRAESARLSLSAAGKSFGGVALGQEAAASITISNTGTQPSSPLSLDEAGDADSFVVGGDCAGRVLAPGDSCTLPVSFRPAALGAKSLSLAIHASPSATARATFDGYGMRVVHLVVLRSGDGQVGVSGTFDSCARQPCFLRFEIGGPVARAGLTATPGEGSVFVQWSGACSGTSPSCDLVIDGDRSVVAEFAPAASVGVDATVLAGGEGTVDLQPGASCQAPCRATSVVQRGSRIRLTARPGAQTQFRWTGACRGTAPVCELTADADAHAGVVFSGANYVFVTSAAYPANLGLAGYDVACNERAAAAGLPGRYLAWLSTKAAPAWSRFSSARGFIHVDGRAFADILAPGGAVYFPPALDEFGRPRSESVRVAMTGTDLYGNTDPQRNCSDWTSAGNDPLKLGDPMTGTATWTGWAWSGCAGRWLIYCMGTGIDRPLVRPIAEGRVAFVSHRALPSGGGVAAADSLCAADAREAGLQGSFKALLATEGKSATSRFDLGGKPWVRPDGVPIVEKAADLAQGQLIAPIDQHASGAYDFEFYTQWAGARGQNEPGTASDTCSSWTSNAPASRTSVASDVTIESNWFGTGDLPCDAWARVLCLQE